MSWSNIMVQINNMPALRLEGHLGMRVSLTQLIPQLMHMPHDFANITGLSLLLLALLHLKGIPALPMPVLSSKLC